MPWVLLTASSPSLPGRPAVMIHLSISPTSISFSLFSCHFLFWSVTLPCSHHLSLPWKLTCSAVPTRVSRKGFHIFVFLIFRCVHTQIVCIKWKRTVKMHACLTVLWHIPLMLLCLITSPIVCHLCSCHTWCFDLKLFRRENVPSVMCLAHLRCYKNNKQ